MSTPVTAPASAHFYLSDPARAFYETENKSKPGEMRKVNIKDARKAEALASFSGVKYVAAEPYGLKEWGYQVFAEAADDVLSKTGGNVLDHLPAIIERNKELREEAMDRGLEIHDGLEAGIAGEPFSTKLAPIVEAVLNWLEENAVIVHRLEHVFANRALGIGGRVDFIGEWKSNGETRLLVLDFKTTETKGREFRFYKPEQPAQLAVYRAGIEEPEASCGNLGISRDEPGRIEFKLWSEKELEEAWKWFDACFNLWRIQNRYDPRNGGTP
jgi:hypothetical protein